MAARVFFVLCSFAVLFLALTMAEGYAHVAVLVGFLAGKIMEPSNA
jgi:hypothetical protein